MKANDREPIYEDEGIPLPDEVENDCAEVFPYQNLVPQELMLDLAQKKRMKKLEKSDNQVRASLEGVFPEIVLDQNHEEETI